MEDGANADAEAIEARFGFTETQENLHLSSGAILEAVPVLEHSCGTDPTSCNVRQAQRATNRPRNAAVLCFEDHPETIPDAESQLRALTWQKIEGVPACAESAFVEPSVSLEHQK